MDYSPPGSSIHGDSPGKNAGAGSLSLLQEVFPAQESNQYLLYCRRILYQLSYQGTPFESSNLPKIWFQWYQHFRWSLVMPPAGIIPFHVVSRMVVCITSKKLQRWCFQKLSHKKHQASYSCLLSSITYSKGNQLPCENMWRDPQSRPLATATWVSLESDPSAPVKASDDSIWPISWLQTHPISSWQIDGETMETVTDFIILGSKITAGGDCSHEIKRRLLLGRKTMTNQTAY